MPHLQFLFPSTPTNLHLAHIFVSGDFVKRGKRKEKKIYYAIFNSPSRIFEEKISVHPIVQCMLYN